MKLGTHNSGTGGKLLWWLTPSTLKRFMNYEFTFEFDAGYWARNNIDIYVLCGCIRGCAD